MLKSFSDKRKNLFTIIAEQLQYYSVYYDWGKLCIRKDNLHFKESDKGNIKIFHNKGITYFSFFSADKV